MLDTFKSNLDIQGNTELVIGLSGGLDSVVTAYLASKIGVPVTAVYVDHGLSENSGKWMIHCANLCHDLGIRFIAEQVELSPESGNIEMQARVKRYSVLERYVDAPNKILLTGHHRDDLSETFLLAMKRGSGVDGLASMPISKTFSSGTHCRPLLSFSKKELMLFASTRSLSWIEDESNSDQKYDRNFLRNTVIPLLDTRWENVSKSIARSAELCAANRTVMEELLVEKLSVLVSKGTFDLSQAKAMGSSKELIFELVRHWLRSQGIKQLPSLKKMNEFWNTFGNARTGSNPVLRLSAEKSLRMYRGVMHVVDSELTASSALNELTRLFDVAATPEQIISEVVKFGAEAKSYKNFERCSWAVTYGGVATYIVTNNKRAVVNDHLHDNGVPPWLRAFIPLIYADDELVYIPVVGFVSEEVRA